MQSSSTSLVRSVCVDNLRAGWQRDQNGLRKNAEVYATLARDLLNIRGFEVRQFNFASVNRQEATKFNILKELRCDGVLGLDSSYNSEPLDLLESMEDPESGVLVAPGQAGPHASHWNGGPSDPGRSGSTFLLWPNPLRSSQWQQVGLLTSRSAHRRLAGI